jgi:hypothetical protein
LSEGVGRTKENSNAHSSFFEKCEPLVIDTGHNNNHHPHHHHNQNIDMINEVTMNLEHRS